MCFALKSDVLLISPLNHTNNIYLLISNEKFKEIKKCLMYEVIGMYMHFL